MYKHYFYSNVKIFFIQNPQNYPKLSKVIHIFMHVVCRFKNRFKNPRVQEQH